MGPDSLYFWRLVQDSPAGRAIFFGMDMPISEIKQKIQHVLKPILERRGAFLVDLQIRNERGQRLVQVFTDTDEGIQIEDCAEISRELSPELEGGEILQGSYHLEVSSPGIDRPLRVLRQYHKNIGRRFTVRYKRANETGELKARLVSVQDDQLTFLPDGGEAVMLPFAQIIESKEELPW